MKKPVNPKKKNSMPNGSSASVPHADAKASPAAFPVVGVGASAGGLDAFKKLIRFIPEDSGIAFVLVQHLDPTHESMLSDILQKSTQIPVSEITDDILLQPNHIYVIPSNKLVQAKGGVLLLTPRPPSSRQEPNMPIDLFFTSLADVYQSHSIGIVLSGTATDGTLGLKAIKDHGGITFAQDEASADYEGMPHSAIQAGVVDFILPPEDMPQKLQEVTAIITKGVIQESGSIAQNEEVFKQMLSLLRVRTGTDFTYYKQTTVRRRILRRMAISKFEAPDAYLSFLRANKAEQDALHQDMLIPVTSFFRDKTVFGTLCESVFPHIIKTKESGETLRVWIAGCSTGEEAYSIAICYKEFLNSYDAELSEKVQIFATDLSESAITFARRGIYSALALEGVSPERLKQFFTKTEGNYQVNKDIRNMCVFATHNFLKDPPFGRMDFISCRNVLIYMEPYLQKKALTTFHYALNQKGFLLLGKSETTGIAADLFGAETLTEKLYHRKDVASRFMLVTSQRSEEMLTQTLPLPAPENNRSDFQKAADDIILGKYSPAGVVVNEAMDIVHFRGTTSDFLEQAAGKPTHNIFLLARSGLAFELRNLLFKVRKEQKPVLKNNIALHTSGMVRMLSIEAMPLPNTIEPHYLVLFHETPVTTISSSPPKSTSRLKNNERDQRIVQLEQELTQLREDIQNITEEQEAANEELQSSNEELMSGSEELQSLNEELATSKEELQSTNEELIVVNQEMISLNLQLAKERNYSKAIVENIPEPVLVLDKNLRIRSANHAFYRVFKQTEFNIENNYIYEIGYGQWNIPDLRRLLENILPSKTTVYGYRINHHYDNIGQRTMLLNACEILKDEVGEKLILLSINDVTEEEAAQQKIADSERRYSTILMQSPFAFSLVKGEEMRITHANELMKNLWGKGDDVIGKKILDLLPELTDQPFPALMKKVLQTGEPENVTEVLARLNRQGSMHEGYFNIVYQPHYEDGIVTGVITIAHEVSDQVLARKKVEESELQFSTLANNIGNLAWMADEAGWIFWYNDRWYEYTGTTPDEMMGWGWKAVHDAESLPGVMEAWQHSINTGEPFEMTFPLKGADQQFRSFLTRVVPMRNGEGKVIRWIGTNTDITAQKETEALLEYRKALLEAHYEASGDGVLLVDWQGSILSYNKRFVDIWNMPPQIVEAGDDEAALNHAMTQLVEPEQFVERVKNLYDHQNEISIDELVFKDGKIIERHGYPVASADGKHFAWSWTFRDVTEARNADKAIRQSEQNFRQLADLMPEKVTNTDADGRVIYFNRNWLEYTGLSFDEMKDWGWAKVIHTDDLRRILPLWKRSIKEGIPLVSEQRLLHKEGEYRWHISRIVPIKDAQGNISKWISTTTEIQQQKEQTEKLENAVRARTQELLQANEDLVKINKELKSFTYVSSHDLQEPLRKIQTFIGRILEKEAQTLSDTGKTYFGRVQQAANRMQALIQDLLAFSSLSNTDKLFEETNLHEIVEAVKDDCRETLIQKGGIIEVKDACTVKVIPFQFKQLMYNLISNALKFSKADVSPHIMISSTNVKYNKDIMGTLAPLRKYCHIQIRDNGIGFDEDHREKIFEVFQKLHSKDVYAGTGIGLAIVKKIVENHHGLIVANGKLNEGAVFDIYIPAS